MALSHYLWSRTASSNATADPAINFAEGQAPSSVNDSARALMASAAGFRDDISGAIVTGGTSTAYTVTSYQIFDSLAHLGGQMVAFSPHTTNGATVTLNCDGLGAKPLRSAPSTELLAGTLIQGTPYLALYNASDAAFYLHGFYGPSPALIPLGSGVDYWGSSAPNSSFALAQGQAISRTTYATLFSLFSTTYGVGDGSTTFNIPDKVGRVSAMLDVGSARISSTYFGGNPANLGAVGGGESKTLLTANLPAYTPAGTVSQVTGTFAASVTALSVSGGGTNLYQGSGNTAVSLSAQTFSGTAQGGVSTPIRTVQPTIVCNYIIRII